MDTYSNGVYGINITQRLQGPNVADLAMLTEIRSRYEELESQALDDDRIGSSLYAEFHERLELFLAKKGISIPSLEESKHGYGAFPENLACKIFRINEVANINEDEEFNHGDLILGVGIFGFPNRIQFRPGFIAAASWHLWTIDE